MNKGLKPLAPTKRRGFRNILRNPFWRKTMTNNVGGFDRLIRLALAAVLFYLGLMVYTGSALGTGLAVAGAIAAITGLLGFCGLYSLLGINTRKADQRPQA
jgi:hypothetical protein